MKLEDRNDQNIEVGNYIHGAKNRICSAHIIGLTHCYLRSTDAVAFYCPEDRDAEIWYGHDCAECETEVYHSARHINDPEKAVE